MQSSGVATERRRTLKRETQESREGNKIGVLGNSSTFVGCNDFSGEHERSIGTGQTGRQWYSESSRRQSRHMAFQRVGIA